MRKFFTPIAFLILVIACNKQDVQKPSEIQESADAPEITAIEQRKCASHEVLEEQMAADPQRRRFIDELERKTERYQGRDKGALRTASKLYVSVYVHVVHTNENIVTDAQINSQIAVLNKDFNKTNSELREDVYLAGYPLSSVANCGIEFVLKGVIRKKTTVSSFGTNDAVKKASMGGSDPVDKEHSLNMWVCNLSNGLLGYAQFPGGSASTDGVVIDLQAFGTTSTGFSLYSQFDLGRTATHEIGHWFNLRHIWGDMRCGNDGVSDTPQHDDANSGCPAQGLKSRCPSKPLEQWMNYMDYTDDACMYMFSDGQKIRMDAAIDLSRATYVSTTKP